MKAHRLIFLFSVAACVMALSSPAQAQQGGRSTICHVSGQSFRSITVAESAVPPHLSHGDSLGPCPTGPVCGDGVLDPGEECDDGNDVDGDGCESDCTLTGSSSSTPTGQVFWFNGNGLNLEAGNGFNWVQVDRPDDNTDDISYEVESFSAQWASSSGTEDNYFAWGRKDGSVWYAQSANTPGTAYQLHDTGWGSSVESIQARSYDGSFALQVVAGLDDGSIQYWTAVDSFYEGTWVQLHDDSWGSAAKFLAVQWPSENGYNGKLRVVVGLENSSTVFYDGDGWRELHDDQWNSETTAMQVYFSDEDYWPAVVQGLDNGAVVYHDISGIWNVLKNDGWASAVNRMQVQFAQENDQYEVKVVAGLNDSSLQYWDGTGWIQLIDEAIGGGSGTEGLCAYFPTDNNDVEKLRVVTGYGDGQVLSSVNLGVAQLAAPGMEGPNVGVADIQCSWENNYLEVVATYANSPVVYYSEVDDYTCLGGANDGDTCSPFDGCPDGACTRWTSLAPYGVGDNNQLAAFSASFAGTPTTGVPKVAGGYQRPGTNILQWLECKVCEKTMNKVINGAFDCSLNCVEFAQEVGGGPEDPVADFVSAACPFICKEYGKLVGATADEVCQAANLCN